jgi:chromosome segregation ATPase
MWELILQWSGTLGGLGAIGMFIKSVYTARVDKRNKIMRGQSDRQTSDVDNIIKLLSVTPAEVIRLHERLAESETRCNALEGRLRAALDEVASLRGQMAQYESQLSRALTQLNRLPRGGNEDGTTV